MIDRVIVLVMDSVGVGAMPDASAYNDDKVNTIQHVYDSRGFLKINNLCSLGLGKLAAVCSDMDIKGCYGKMKEISPGKDTTTGHWEMAGAVLDFSFPTYPDGFPDEIINEFEKRTGTKTLGNFACSGTEIIKKLGEEHLKTGNPIVYTSADSVFQIAANEAVIPLDKLYEYCLIARDILKEPHAMARVIARPFVGRPGSFARNEAGRKDFSIEPVKDTLLDVMKAGGYFVCGVGKIGDIFGHRGLTEEVHTDNNMDGMDKTLKMIEKYRDDRGLIFVNLVEFDSVYGHRRNPQGYAKALEDLDVRVREIMESLKNNELLIITADHGCDPTHMVHTDHTREYVPLLVYGKGIKSGLDLGMRESFADVGQTVAECMGDIELKSGKSFLKDILYE